MTFTLPLIARLSAALRPATKSYFIQRTYGIYIPVHARKSSHIIRHVSTSLPSDSDSNRTAKDDDDGAVDGHMDAAITTTTTTPLASGLYVVPTPIGCLEDITLRALRILRDSDKILCEDTRRTSILLRHFHIHTPTESYHRYNERSKLSKVIEGLRTQAMALVSDAGMPAINDPGGQLIAAAVEAGVPIIPVPGPSATLTALLGSGLSTDSFTFCGFTEAKSSARKKQFLKWRSVPSTLIFFVSPHSLLDALKDGVEVFGEGRRCCLARELTKMNEEFWRGTVQEAVEEFERRGPRGEFTWVIEGGSEEEVELTDEEVIEALEGAMGEGNSPSQAAKVVTERFGFKRVSKKRAYKLSLSIKSSSSPL